MLGAGDTGTGKIREDPALAGAVTHSDGCTIQDGFRETITGPPQIGW